MHPARTHQRIVIIAHHLVLTLDGHWPPNDPRGSGSRDFYDDKFAFGGASTTSTRSLS